MQRFKQSGFTLIELIIVIAIIALLAAATFVAVNPAKRIGDANNAQRWADVTAIADAWMKYIVDNNGTNVTSSSCVSDELNCRIAAYGIGGAASTSAPCDAATQNGTVWLDALVTEGYIGTIPYDPSSTYVDGTTSTGYYFKKDSNNVVTVGACNTYNAQIIKVIR